MTIGQIHDFFFLLKNQGQGGYHSHEDIDRALNSASSDKFNEEKRLFERDQFISDNLSVFKTVASVVLTSGFGSKPDDYDYAINASTADDEQIDIVPESEWITRINDPIAIPTAAYPILAVRDQFEIVPHSVADFNIHYLRFPTDSQYVYALDGDGNVVQNVGASIDPEWPPSCDVDLVLRSCGYLGVPLSDDLLIKLKSFKRQTEGV